MYNITVDPSRSLAQVISPTGLLSWRRFTGHLRKTKYDKYF